jgi:NAD(P)-dependent dehydrogenase (short-subunit alcohol dehydrogenase family)
MAVAEFSLAGKVAIVTGGSRGIGRAIATRLAREGAHVVIGARDAAALAATAGEIGKAGGEVTTSAGDLRDPERVEALWRLAVESHGGIDIVVNNAGATRRGEFVELSETDWMDGFALKFFGAVRLLRAAWPYLKERRGAVLNIIGTGGRTPGPEFTLGGAVNGAFLSFTKALADVWVRDGVQVNAINPGYIRTDRLQGWIKSVAAETGGDLHAAQREMVRRANIVRIGEPEDIANLAAFILLPENRLLHGALIDLDGGLTKTV